jgi:gamma-glutamylcyclotransferase (GGCT)/AIG2-like uncharacterized protein YtfP
MDLLFVYGSLRSAFDNPHARRLRAEAECMGEGRIAGAIYLVDWYPGYRRGLAGEVMGEVYRVGDATLAALDEYEGTEYNRVSVEVGGIGRAWVYEFAGEVSGMARIESGDFLSR